MAVHMNEFSIMGPWGPTLILIEMKYTVNIHNALHNELNNFEALISRIKKTSLLVDTSWYGE